jgi:hypothetical protein
MRPLRDLICALASYRQHHAELGLAALSGQPHRKRNLLAGIAGSRGIGEPVIKALTASN